MEEEQEIDLDQITDENLLQSLLDQTDDPEDRKVIRDRINELRATKKNVREEKITKLTNTREEMLQQKKKEAEHHKQRTLDMYDNMAKSAPAGNKKTMDVNALKTETNKKNTTTTSHTTTTTTSNKAISDYKFIGNAPNVIGSKKDYVEDAIKKRQREAEERKKRILAAFDVAAKSTPAGAPKDVDFDSRIDVSQYEQKKVQESGITFQMSGGVPVVKQTVQVSSSTTIKDESTMDVMERSLRDRQRECEERKQKILEQYSQISKQKAGPKIFA